MDVAWLQAFEEDGILLESQQTTCCCITPDGRRMLQLKCIGTTGHIPRLIMTLMYLVPAYVGTRLIAGTKDGRVVVTHLKTRKQEAETKLFEKPVTSVVCADAELWLRFPAKKTQRTLGTGGLIDEQVV